MEFKRILWNRRTLWTFVMLLFVNLGVFYFFSLKDYTPLPMDEVKETDYQKRYEEIQKQIELVEKITIFSEGAEIQEQEKTLQDYKRIRSVDAVTEQEEGISSWAGDGYSHYFILAFLVMLISVSFDTEKTGLFPLVYSAKNGRVSLMLKRFVLFLSAAVGSTFLFQGTMLISAYLKTGNLKSVLKPIQCIQGFENCIKPVNGLQFVLLSMLVSAEVIAVCVLFVWFFLLLIHNNKIAITLCGIIFVLKYFMAHWILPQSKWSLLREINLISLLNTNRYFKEYKVINIGGLCLERMEWIQLLMPGLILLLGALCVVAGAKRRPFYYENWLERQMHFISGKFRKLVSRMPGFFCEWYKILFSQKGLFVFVFLLLVISRSIWQPVSASQVVTLGSKAEYMDDFYEEWEGPVTESTKEHIKQLDKQLAVLIQKESPAVEYYGKGLLEVKKRMKYIGNSGNPLWLVNDRGYRQLFGKTGDEKSLVNSVLILLCMAVLIAGMFPYEKKTGMTVALQSLPGGRNRLYRRKMGVVFSMCVLLWGLYLVVEIYPVQHYASLGAWSAPVQSLPFMKNFSPALSIWQYYVLILILRFIVLTGFAFLFSGISRWSKKQEYGIIFMLILTLSSVLYMMGNMNLSVLAIAKLIRVSNFLRMGGVGCAKWWIATGVIIGLAFLLEKAYRRRKVC